MLLASPKMINQMFNVDTSNLHLKLLFFDIIFIVTLTPKGTLVVFQISPKYVFYQINIGPMSFSMYLW